ncbi:MAG: hypothetical protein BGN88_00600 [Clostridiales bacterium 43-6]|nr:MAG: hypothetical protein BGN88_00600 [Clostridiales bacterium 43-6]
MFLMPTKFIKIMTCILLLSFVALFILIALCINEWDKVVILSLFLFFPAFLLPFFIIDWKVRNQPIQKESVTVIELELVETSRGDYLPRYLIILTQLLKSRRYFNVPIFEYIARFELSDKQVKEFRVKKKMYEFLKENDQGTLTFQETKKAQAGDDNNTIWKQNHFPYRRQRYLIRFEKDRGQQYIFLKDASKIPDREYSRRNDLINIVIPDTVIFIGKQAFSGCKELNSVFIPCSVSDIGSGAFGYCEKLEFLTISEGITKINIDAFLDNVNLKELLLPDSIKIIQCKALYGKFLYLEKIRLPKGLDFISKEFIHMLNDCNSLKEIEAPPHLYDKIVQAFKKRNVTIMKRQ